MKYSPNYHKLMIIHMDHDHHEIFPSLSSLYSPMDHAIISYGSFPPGTFSPWFSPGYVRAKSFSHGLGRVASDSSKDTATAPPVERHRTAPAPTAPTAAAGEPAIEAGGEP